ncbi:hypothetical protein GGQ74_000067 [Desulfobaculum xiamenense]|uniref:Tip attachment protein J domain-containing protein n=1 Tax=Desulfobaculum xiamenense TaxID=995050 RepID=A0A846QHE3_9BACT|nr:phage tail protein [Desulfobaculum xiamenense]NJB66427.1 hypothetical protein [Desulfobaculum xiamenense]
MGGGGKGGGGSTTYTAGYWYGLGMHMVLCHGVIDAVTRIIVGERVAWQGRSGAGRVHIDAPDLLGGEEREGGVVGDVDVATGTADQPPNDYLQAWCGTVPADCVGKPPAEVPEAVRALARAWGASDSQPLPATLGPVPAFRGVAALILRAPWLSAMSSYIKPWWVEVERIPRGWYAARAAIGQHGDANPAHIIRECLTDRVWGRGFWPEQIDDASFTAAADALTAEGFGLSCLWDGNGSVAGFVDEVLRHIDATLREDASGRQQLVLVRDDYDPDTLPEYGPETIESVTDFSRPAWGGVPTRATLSYTERELGKTATVTAHDIAAEAMQGRGEPMDLSFPFITDPELAARVASRELRQAVSMLAQATVTGGEALATLRQGDVFALRWPLLGVERMVVRVVESTHGRLRSGEVRLRVVQDVFAATSAVYGAQVSGWADPVSPPQAAPERLLVELPYYEIVRRVASEQWLAVLAKAEELDPEAGYLLALARRPTGDATGYAIEARAAGMEFEAAGHGTFAETDSLTEAVGVVDAVLPLAGALDADALDLPCLAYLDGEIVELLELTAEGARVHRGVIDTVPQPHEPGARLWVPVADGGDGVVSREWTAGEEIEARCLPLTGHGRLDAASAPVDALAMNARAARPLPPGRLRICDQAHPATITGELTVSWAHRDRMQQTATPVPQDAGDIGPEPGTRYVLEIHGDGGALRRRVEGEAWALPVVNGNAEAGNLSGWSVDAGAVEVRSANPAPAEGDACFALAAGAAMHQDVELAGAGVRLAAVDAGLAEVGVAWRQAADDGASAGTVAVAALAADGSELAQLAAAAVSVPAGTWQPRTLTLALPAGTRRVRVCVRCDSGAGASAFDGVQAQAAASAMLGNRYTYAEAVERADSGGTLNAELHVTLWSERDGYDSWQRQQWTGRREGGTT